MPIDSNWNENQIRPIAIGRNNCLFTGSLRSGQRAVAVMSLFQSFNLNEHDPYLKLGRHYVSQLACWTSPAFVDTSQRLLELIWLPVTGH